MKPMMFVTLSATVMLAACASRTITGQTMAGGTLKSDAFRMVASAAAVDAKCRQVDSMKTEVLAINPPGTGDTEAKRRNGSVNERWTVSLCGQTIPYRVTFVPDGQGGTYINTVRE